MAKAHKSCTQCRERTRGGCGHPALTHALIGQPTPNPRNNGRECPCFAKNAADPMTGFKVVRAIRGRYVSAIGNTRAPVEYLKRKWAKPRPGCGPLAVFTDKASAINFTMLYAMSSLIVFRCLYKPSLDETLWDGVLIVPANLLPSGSALATKVSLMERIDP